MLIQESSVRLENMLTKIGTTNPLSQIHQRAMVTLMVDNLFSLKSKDYPTRLASGEKHHSLKLLQREVDRIEWVLQGGCDTDAESDNERTPHSARTGRYAMQLRL